MSIQRFIPVFDLFFACQASTDFLRAALEDFRTGVNSKVAGILEE